MTLDSKVQVALLVVQILTLVFLAITAIVATIYTLETSKIRKTADENARRANVPVLKFRVEPGKDKDLDMRFFVENKTGRRAVVRATVRIRCRGIDRTFETGPYSGKDDWEIWAHDRWNGHFHLTDLLGEWKEPPVDELIKTGPVETVSLDAQVAVYNGRGEFQYLYRREYYLELIKHETFRRVRPPGGEPERLFWPEVAPRTFCTAPYPDRLAVDTGQGTRDLL